jgi:hypothetical protein
MRQIKVLGLKIDIYTNINLNHLLNLFLDCIDLNIDDYNSKEVFDCLLVIYKVCPVFVLYH